MVKPEDFTAEAWCDLCTLVYDALCVGDIDLACGYLESHGFSEADRPEEE